MLQALHELVASRIPVAGDNMKNMMLVVTKSAGLDMKRLVLLGQVM